MGKDIYRGYHKESDGVVTRRVGGRLGVWPFGKMGFANVIKGADPIHGDFRTLGGAHRVGKKLARQARV